MQLKMASKPPLAYIVPNTADSLTSEVDAKLYQSTWDREMYPGRCLKDNEHLVR
jgi:hypothetical protein